MYLHPGGMQFIGDICSKKTDCESNNILCNDCQRHADKKNTVIAPTDCWLPKDGPAPCCERLGIHYELAGLASVNWIMMASAVSYESPANLARVSTACA